MGQINGIFIVVSLEPPPHRNATQQGPPHSMRDGWMLEVGMAARAQSHLFVPVCPPPLNTPRVFGFPFQCLTNTQAIPSGLPSYPTGEVVRGVRPIYFSRRRIRTGLRIPTKKLRESSSSSSSSSASSSSSSSSSREALGGPKVS